MSEVCTEFRGEKGNPWAASLFTLLLLWRKNIGAALPRKTPESFDSGVAVRRGCEELEGLLAAGLCLEPLSSRSMPPSLAPIPPLPHLGPIAMKFKGASVAALNVLRTLSVTELAVVLVTKTYSDAPWGVKVIVGTALKAVLKFTT